MRRLLAIVVLAGSVGCGVSAQTKGAEDMRARYEEFKSRARKNYSDFREEANRRHAEFMRRAWARYKSLPELERPKDEKRPPVVMPERDRDKLPESVPVTLEEVVTPQPPAPQPAPPAPIREQPEPPGQEYAVFRFYGTECKVRFNRELRFRLTDCSERGMAKLWERLSAGDYDNTLRDCLELRERLALGDWGYVKLLDAVSEACMGGKGNEANMLKAYIYCQSGYKVRIGMGNGAVYPLYASRHQIYGTRRFDVGGDMLYVFDCQETQLHICDVPFPQEKPMSLWIDRTPALVHTPTESRVLQSQSNKDVKAEVKVNKNLIDFYDGYPSSATGDDFMTRWAMYANTPMSDDVKRLLYPSLEEGIRNMPQREAACRLLNFVQTAFEYEYDDKVWGCDRAFFAEETLYYPYCDCEDRSILFSRLVRDLMGLDVALVYYPGHLATAVAFNDEVPGDYIELGGRRYVVCDPTFIGAPVGMTMPGMDNSGAKVLLLSRK